MIMKHVIDIEKRDEETEEWKTILSGVHCNVNKNTRKKGYETVSGGAIRIKRSLTFEVRYSKPIRQIAHNTQLYRIIYQGQTYDIIDYDDFEERHKFVQLSGAFY